MGEGMNIDQFVVEANRLARAVTELKEGEGSPMAFWHGQGPTGHPIITFWYQDRWLELHADEDAGYVVSVKEPRHAGIPLVGSLKDSMPPIDTVFRFGSSDVGTYLAEHGWQRDWPYNSNFRHDAAQQYEELWMSQCPMYSNTVVAVIGGWNFPWPDSDWEECSEMELVLWTLRDAEPWIEVFRDDSHWVVKQRNT